MADSMRHVPLRRTRILTTLIGSAATVVAALAIPGTAGAVTLGSTHIAQGSQAGIFCGGFPSCAFAQTSLPDGVTRAPFKGRIRSWKVNLQDPGSLQLLVLRKRDDGSFKAVEGSSPRTTDVDEVNRFRANLPVRKGDLVGLNLLDEDIVIQVLNPRNARSKGFMPAFDVGGAQEPYGPFNSTFDELQFNATLKR